MNLVIDTNIFISALIKDSLMRNLIVNSPFNLFIPEQEIIEIRKYEELILRKSGQTRDELRDLIGILLKYVTIIKNKNLLNYKPKAEEIMKRIDKSDIPFIASALALKCPIWSDDKHFQKQKEIKIFTTKDILKQGL